MGEYQPPWLEQSTAEFQALPKIENRARMAFALTLVTETRGVSMTAISRALGVSPNTTARWFRGETLPDAIQLGALSAFLDVDPALLIFPPPVPENPIGRYLKANG